MRFIALVGCAVVGVGCGGAPAPTPGDVATAASASSAPRAAAPVSQVEPGKGLVVSPKCSDVHDAVRVDVDESGAAGVLMVHVTNTSTDLLSVFGASKRASAGYDGLEQGDHISFQMKKGDNYYVIAARTKDVFTGGDFHAGAPTPCTDEAHSLEAETRTRVGLRPKH